MKLKTEWEQRLPILELCALHSFVASVHASLVKEDAGCQGGISPPVNKPIPTAEAFMTPTPLDSKKSRYWTKSECQCQQLKEINYLCRRKYTAIELNYKIGEKHKMNDFNFIPWLRIFNLQYDKTVSIVPGGNISIILKI